VVLRVIGVDIGVVGILVIRVLGDLLLVLLEFFLCEDFVYLLISWIVLVLRSVTLLIKFSRLGRMVMRGMMNRKFVVMWKCWLTELWRACRIRTTMIIEANVVARPLLNRMTFLLMLGRTRSQKTRF
jgi:hypothetical protein